MGVFEVYKIVLLDDETFAWNRLKKSMNWGTYNMDMPVLFCNPVEAMEYIIKNDVDGIFLDIRMPVMDGIEFAKNIYEVRPEIPIFVISAYEQFEYAQQLFKYNIIGYFIKPITKEKLSAACSEMQQNISTHKKNQNNRSFNNDMKFRLSSPKLLLKFFSNISENIDNMELIDNINTTVFNNNFNLFNLPFAEMTVYDNNTEVSTNGYLGNGNIEAIYNSHSNLMLSSDLYILPVMCTYEKISVFILSKTETISDFMKQVECFQNDFRQNCINYLDSEVTIEIENIYNDLNDYRNRIYDTTEIEKWVDDMFSLKDTNITKKYLELLRKYKYNSSFLRVLANSIYINLINKFGYKNVINSSMIPNEFFKLINTPAVDSSLDAAQIIQKTIWNVETMIMSRRFKSNDIIPMAKIYINNNFTENLLIENMSSLFFISPSHFSRKFKAETGMSFLTYLNQIRMENVCTQLILSDKSINEISESVGYTNFSYFCKKFKSIVGCTAAEFRNKHDV